MSVKSNIEIIYKQIPGPGHPNPDTDFEVRHGKIDLDKTEVTEGQILVRTIYVSLDPYIRKLLEPPAPSKASFQSLKPGDKMSSAVVGEVLKSANPKYDVGDFIVGVGSWSNYSVIDANSPRTVVQKIPNGKTAPFPLSYYLGVFNLSGMTAYIGMQRIGAPFKAGETLYVSAAAGAVGQIAGQYGKAQGLRVVGSAGDDAKVEFLTKELGFDAAFNYKKVADLDAALKENCPKGIDIYFENVGGKMLDAVLLNCNNHARIICSGMISQMEKKEPLHNISLIVAKRIRMEGYMTFDHMRTYMPEGIATFTKLLEQGKMKCKEDVTKGIENLPKAFVGMLQGKNFGKAVVQATDV